MVKLEDSDNAPSWQDSMMPMIDVIFVLIAFMMLMINAPLVTMKLDLPKTVEKQSSNSLNNVISISLQDDSNTWQLDALEILSLEQLEQNLLERKTQATEQLSVVVHSDKTVDMERIVQLFSMLQKLELSVTHIALKE